MVLSLGDVLDAMAQREGTSESMIHYLYVTGYLEIIHKIPPEEALKLPNDTVVELLNLPPKPLKYAGWDTFIWGEAATRGRSSG